MKYYINNYLSPTHTHTHTNIRREENEARKDLLIIARVNALSVFHSDNFHAVLRLIFLSTSAVGTVS